MRVLLLALGELGTSMLETFPVFRDLRVSFKHLRPVLAAL